MPPRVRDLNPSAPQELERIIEKALEKNRKLRYQTASDLGADLRRLKRDLDSQNLVFVPPPGALVTHPAPADPRPPASRRHRVAAGAAAAAAAALASLSFSGLLVAPGAGAPDDSPQLATTLPTVPDVRLPPMHRLETAVTPAAHRPARPAPRPLPPTEAPEPDRQWAREQLAAARSKLDLKLYEQAIGTLEALLSKDSRSDEALDAYLLMASIYEVRDERDDAISTYLDIATRYPDSARAPEALVKMGDAMLRSRRRDKELEALQTYTDVGDRYPSSPWAERALISKAGIEERLGLHQRDDALAASVPSALVTYRQLVERHPGSSGREAALWKLSQLYQRVRRYDLAADALETLGESYPSSRHEGWFSAAEIYEKRLKQPLNARSAYARVPISSPKYEEAQKRLARR